MNEEQQKEYEERVSPDMDYLQYMMEHPEMFEGQEKEPECDCCGWDDCGHTHEPGCALLTKT